MAIKRSLGNWCMFAGWLIFLTCTANLAVNYGGHWKFGRYYMPETLLAPDDWHYADGQVASAFAVALTHSGCEAEAMLVMLGMLALATAWLAYELWKWIRLRRQIELSKRGDGRRRHGIVYDPVPLPFKPGR